MAESEDPKMGLFRGESVEIETELSADEVISRLEKAVSADPGAGEVPEAGLEGKVAGRKLRLAAIEQNTGWVPILKAGVEETDQGAVVRGRFVVPWFARLFALLWLVTVGWVIYSAVHTGDSSHFVGAAFLVGCGVLVVVLGRASGKESIPKVRRRLERIVE